jgi:hypothetical protein
MNPTRKRRRTAVDAAFTSSGQATPSDLENRSIEFTDRPDRIRRLGQVSSSTVVEEAFGQEDLNEPTDVYPQDYRFYDSPSGPTLEESGEIEEDDHVSLKYWSHFVCVNLRLLIDI